MSFDVIIITHGFRPFVLNAIHSAFNQTLAPQNIYVVHNNYEIQCDKIYSRVRSYQTTNFELIKVTNTTLGEARNVGLGFCQSDYVALLDDDDIWRNCRLINAKNFIKKSGLDVASCNFFCFDSHGNEFYDQTLALLPFGKNLQESLHISNYFSGGSAAIISKSVYKKNKFSSLKASEDWEYWLRIAKAGYKIDVDYDNQDVGIFKGDKNYGSDKSRDLQGTYQVLKMHVANIKIKQKELAEKAISEHLVRALSVREYKLAIKIFLILPSSTVLFRALKFIVRHA